jgi:DNA-binding winged helix-turn-helix (wHTH) protein
MLTNGFGSARTPDQAARFGPFLVIPAQRLLLEGGQEVRIGSRAFDLLVILIRHAGHVVSKATLMAEAWPNIVVEEANVRIHIAALRKLLSERNVGARYIVNSVGRGYCFVAPLERESKPASERLASPSLQCASARTHPPGESATPPG